MYLQNLQLIGFKSFVEKTTLEFGPGTGAIVGPNGCGKSNVSDAIRWVLGEQSAKSLRGSEMTDVIFNGTDTRKPLGMAEVSLTIGDASKELGLEYNEITITRRVFRDGTGEYLVNKTPCRLRDIQQLFMDTGIGRTSYWLMEQGKMDKILATRPEDRRVIFEEAAGITKYRAQKHEALNKLELTNRNLEQLEPLLKEIKRQIISLQRQAGKARRYKELCAGLKALETRLARHRFDELQLDITNLQSQVDALAAQLQEATRAIESEETAVTQSRAAEQAIDRQLAELERRGMEIAGEIRRNEDRVQFNQKRIEEMAADREQKTADLTSAHEKIRTQQQLVAQAEEHRAAQETELGAVEARYHEQQAAAKQADGALQQADRKLADIKDLTLSTEQRLTQLRNERVKIEQQRLADARRTERLAAERGMQEERMEKLTQRASTFEQSLAQLQAVAEQARKAFVAVEQELAHAIAAARQPNGNVVAALDVVIAVLVKAGEARAKWFQAEIAWAETRGETKSLHSEQSDAKGRLETATWELKSLAEQGTGQERISEIEELLTDLVASEGQARERLRAAQTMRDDLALSRANQQEKLGQAKVAWLSAQSASTASRERKEATVARLAEMREQISRWQSEMGRYEERVGGLEREIASARAATEDWQAKAKAVEKDLATKRGERATAGATTEAHETTTRQKRQSLSQLQQQRGNLEVKLAERNKDIENLSREMQQRYQIDLSSVPLESPNGAEDWTTVQDKVDELRIRIEEMGPVNTEAIQEYDELEKRHQEISQQQRDLVKSRENLKEAIAKINATAKRLFEETFEKINANFQEMFTELFSGGRASLTLVEVGEGSDDVLERGVEIMARPPGKQLQTIGLLSGGEKALTAIALIFAIYMVKPAPFCVFDELDAPLDESNVGRFCKVVQRFMSQSQFVIITHNKRTMAMADVLYGVTMEESGVSKIVSVNFKKADDEPAGAAKPGLVLAETAKAAMTASTKTPAP